MGISAGCLQWNAGQGTLQALLRMTLGDSPVANDQYAPLFALKDMSPAAAIAYALRKWIDPHSASKNLTPAAKELWQELLGTPQCIAAQVRSAQAILDKALSEAATFLPWRDDVSDNSRIAAFFFDLRVQQGGLSKKMADGSHRPAPLNGADSADPSKAIATATQQGRTKTATAWQQAVNSGDELASVLLHYAFERSRLGNPTYMWDTLSRRGSIAARSGQVHGVWFDFMDILS